ncbi:hypothetical protein RCL1_006937 [Eukaryota sp. TZLM3-RCL]
MATAQATRQSTSEQSVTQVQSLTLVRNLMRTAISSVCYLRNLFPEDCFEDRPLAGLTIKSLLSNVTEAKTIVSWLELGVFEALQKKYLREIVFGIYLDPKHESTLIESYTFRIGYDGDNVSLDIAQKSESSNTSRKLAVDREAVRKSTTTMLRTLITLAQTLSAVPAERYIVMKLFYYDDVTPADYEPVFFRSATFDEAFNYVSKPLKLEIGSVTTPYHSLGLKIKTAIDNLDRLEHFKAQSEDGDEIALIDDGEAVVDAKDTGDSQQSPEVVYPSEQTDDVVQEDDVEDANSTAMPASEEHPVLVPANEQISEVEHVEVRNVIRSYILESRVTKIGLIKNKIHATSGEIRTVLNDLVQQGILSSTGHGITAKYSFIDGTSVENVHETDMVAGKKRRGLVVVDVNDSQVQRKNVEKVSITREPIHQFIQPKTKRANIL